MVVFYVHAFGHIRFLESNKLKKREILPKFGLFESTLAYINKTKAKKRTTLPKIADAPEVPAGAGAANASLSIVEDIW